jgi:hypothetical protein
VTAAVDLDRYRALGAERARRERELTTAAVHDLVSLLDDRGVGVDTYLETADSVRASVPERYRAEFEGMVSELSVSEDELALYTFGLSEVASDLTDGAAGEECTNAVVAAERSATGAPLVLKNRDISARGLRPQTVFELPPVGDHNAVLTTSTAGSVFVFQGVNDAGLVAANTFVDRAREDVDTEDRLRNGVLVRRILEECDDVDGALSLVEDCDVATSKGLTLSLADGTDARLLELDPQGPTVRTVPLADGAVGRTNHFPGAGDPEDDDSTVFRLERARRLVDGLPDDATVEDLFDVASDHRNGPGPNSICRHPVSPQGDPFTLGQSTTVGTTVYRGGEPAMFSAVGNPCRSGFRRYELRGE